MIQFNCTNCGRSLSLPDAYAGRAGRCKACGAKIRIPEDGGRDRDRTADDAPGDNAAAQPDRSKEVASLETLLFESRTGETLRSQLAACGMIAAVVMGVGFGALIGSGFGSGLAGALLGGLVGSALFILYPLIRSRLRGGDAE